MPDFIFNLHSGLRYLVLFAGVVAALYALAGWARSRTFDARGRMFGAIFTGLLDLQVLIGILTLFVRPFYGALMGHLTMMVVAVVVAHLVSVRVRRGPASREKFRLQAIGILITIGIIAAGIMAIGRSPI